MRRRYRSGIIDQGFGDAGCTIKQALPVNAQKSSGHEADSGKGGIAAAQKIRGFERNKESFGLIPAAKSPFRGSVTTIICSFQASPRELCSQLRARKYWARGFGVPPDFADAKHNGFRGSSFAKQALKLFRAKRTGNPEPGAVIIQAITSAGAKTRWMARAPKASEPPMPKSSCVCSFSCVQ